MWSHNASASLTPPPSGWKIPWDGTVRNTLSVANKVGCRQGCSTWENDRSYSFGDTPEIGIPLNYQFLGGFSSINHPAIGVPPFMEPPSCNSYLVRILRPIFRVKGQSPLVHLSRPINKRMRRKWNSSALTDLVGCICSAWGRFGIW